MAKRRSKGCLFLVILVTVSVGAYLTNPTEKMHQAAAKEKFVQLADNLLSDYGIEKSLIARLGIDLSGQFVDDFIESHITADNYFLFSITRINWDGRSQIIGAGAFRRVYISNQIDDVLKREVENYIKEKMKGLQFPGIDLKKFKLELGL